MPKLTSTNAYSSLVEKVRNEFSQLESFLKRRTVQSYWKIGRYIHEHLLVHKDRAEYGALLYEKLAKDVGRDLTALTRAVQFFRTYPILAERQELTWEHYKSLITVEDQAERKKLEAKIAEQNWNSTKLRNYLSGKRKLKQTSHPATSVVVQLKSTRGKLNNYPLVETSAFVSKTKVLAVDLGFRLQYFPITQPPGQQKGGIVEFIFEGTKAPSLQKSSIAKEQLFTYVASVERIIDGDTLLVHFDFSLNVTLSQKLRLRGIDCAEINTPLGRKAKRFVEKELKGCDFIIVKTYKDRSDKFDRYLADIFYKPGEPNPHVVAQEGRYLNQELLDERLANVY